jgi:hypothetical protein
MKSLQTKLTQIGAYLKTREGLLVLLCSLILVVASCYAAVQASHLYATNSDAVVDVYMFDDGLDRNQIIVPGQHANILKYPLFIAQGFFPYNLTTFIAVNGGLVVLCILLWALLLIKLFGRKYAPLILLATAALTISSTEFVINLAETTVRNIEFPLALWFIIIINNVLRQKAYTKYSRIAVILGCVLYTVMLAGDNLFIYAVSLPLLIILGGFWLQRRTLTKPMMQAIAIVIATTLGSFLLKTFMDAAGLIIASKASFSPTVVDSGLFFPSLITAGSQLLHLQGAYIFGKTIGPETATIFVNFILFLVGLLGLGLILVRLGKTYASKGKLTDNNLFIYATLALSFLFSLGVYVMTGQVVQQLANGTIVNMGQIRYLAFVPLLLLVGFVWIIKEYYSKHRWLMIGLLCLFIVEMITITPTIHRFYTKQVAALVPVIEQHDARAAYLQQEGVSDIITGYWEGSTLRFWSEDTIDFAPVNGCKYPFSINTRVDWYAPESGKSALLVSRSGPDAQFWQCDDQTLMQIYGQPTSRKTVGDGEIWIYDTDVRSRLPVYGQDPLIY